MANYTDREKNAFQKEWEKIVKSASEASKEYQEFQKKINAIYKGQYDEMKDLAEIIEKNGVIKETGKLDKILRGEQNEYAKIFEAAKKLLDEQEKIREKFGAGSANEKLAQEMYKMKHGSGSSGFAPNTEDFEDKLTKKTTDKLNKGLAKMFTDFDDFGHFGEKLKNLGIGVLEDALQTTLESVLENIINPKNIQWLFDSGKNAMGWLKDFAGNLNPWKKGGTEEGSPTGAAANIPGLLNFSAVGKSKVGEDGTSGGMEAMFSKMTEYFTKTFSAEGPFGSVISMFTNSFSTLFGSNGLFGSLFNALGGMFSSVFSSLGGILGGAGSSGIGSFLVSAASSLLLFHSGGTVPQGANTKLPGTKEQLALLKGGERILSPGENVQYERENQTPTVNVLNFNIKAWDSKDVQKYLLENRQLLNSITAQGIKDNNQHLRTMVKYA